MSTLGDMLNLKFDSLLDFVQAFPNEETCIKYLEQLIWYGIPVTLQCYRPYELTRNFSNEFQVKSYDVFKYAFKENYLTYSEFDRDIEKLYYSNKHSKQQENVIVSILEKRAYGIIDDVGQIP